MKKRDIIKLVKETVAKRRKKFYGQHDYYGNNVGGRNSISGMPGVWEGESTSFKVVNADTGKTIDFGIDQAKAEEIVAAAKEDNINAKVVKMKNADDTGKLDEEGASWGLEIRQIADSFTFDELEQLYKDNKISKEDLTGAKGYLQAWIDQHPTYLPQRDLNTSKRQAIRSYYLDPNRTTPKGGTQSSQFENKELSDNPKLQPGKTVTYSGTRYKVIENSGYVLTLQSLESGKTLKLNLGQLKDKPIKENNMKKSQLREDSEQEFEVEYAGGKTSMVKMSQKTADQLKSNPKVVSLYNIDASKDLKEKYLDEEPNEISYDDAKEKGLDNPDKADISKDKDISDYELKRGMAIQKAMDDQEKNEGHMELTNDIGKDDYVDDEGRMAKSQMYKTGKYAMKLHDMLGDMEQLPAWVQAKLTKASDYLSAVYHYLDYEFARRDSNLMEHVDKHKKRATLMESATKKLYKRFAAGDSNEDIRNHYLAQDVDMPESFIEKLRKNYDEYEDLIHNRKQLDREAENLKPVRSTSSTGMESGEVGMEEDKQLASGLFKK
jgi:hypothetical protein